MIFLILRWRAAGRIWWERDGRPKSTQTEVKIAAVADLVKNDHQIASRMIAESQDIPKTVVLQISKRIWERESCVHILFHTPWHLSHGKIESHLAKTLSWWVRQTKIFFNKIITGDEPWCFAYDPKIKQKRSGWVGETSPQPKKLKFQGSHIINMVFRPCW